MKKLISGLFVLFAISASSAWADGYRCEGRGYRVKLYNETQPEDGTRNPAVLIVSRKKGGTIARIEEELEKEITETALVYSGQSHSAEDGKFLNVTLKVYKEF